SSPRSALRCCTPRPRCGLARCRAEDRKQPPQGCGGFSTTISSERMPTVDDLEPAVAAERRRLGRTEAPDPLRRSLLMGAVGALADAALYPLWSSAEAQTASQAPVLGSQVLPPILSQPGWNKWMENGEIVPLYEGEIALLKSTAATPVFGDAAEARATQV